MMFRGLRGWFGRWERDEKSRRRRGMWAQSHLGHMYWPIDPLPEDIEQVDMVIGLARENRYRGQTKFPYSVAQHSCYVSDAVFKLAKLEGQTTWWANRAAFAGLLHDAPEAWLGDVARPLKMQRVMRGYRKVEAAWWNAVLEKFDVQVDKDMMRLVEEVDSRIVLDEVKVLMFDPGMWWRRNRYPGRRPLEIDIEPWSEERAIEEFNTRFRELR